MTYECFRKKVENLVNEAKDDNLILDIMLTDSTLNQLFKAGQDFYVENNMLSFVLPEENLIKIINTTEFSVEEKHIRAFWQIVQFNAYIWNPDIPRKQKIAYVL